jgi:molybdopterin-containing oxidoreductase family membrane subunit
MDAFTVFYGAQPAERTEFIERVFGYYAAIYWSTIVMNVMVPQLLWFRRIRLNQPAVLFISFAIIVGMWCERFMIVVVSLHRSHLPSSWGVFHATVWDWLTMAGTVGFFFFGILLMVRLIPMIAMFEMRELLPPRRTS